MVTFDLTVDATVQESTPPSGTTVSQYASNPILDAGSSGEWDDDIIQDTNIVEVSGTYYLFYSGATSDTSGNFDGMQIGVASSSDGETFSKNANNPILTLGSGGSWDDYSVRSPDIIKQDSTYYMGYSGMSDGSTVSLGLASTSDTDFPTGWSKESSVNPILTSSDILGSYGPNRADIRFWDNQYHLWYQMGGGGISSDSHISFATLPDGTDLPSANWTETADAPIIETKSGTFRSNLVESPHPFTRDGNRYVYFDGWTGSLLHGGIAYKESEGNWTVFESGLDTTESGEDEGGHGAFLPGAFDGASSLTGDDEAVFFYASRDSSTEDWDIHRLTFGNLQTALQPGSSGITVHEDSSGDGTADNSATQTLSDGVNTYSLSGFDGSSGNEVWAVLNMDADDLTQTPVINSVELQV